MDLCNCFHGYRANFGRYIAHIAHPFLLFCDIQAMEGTKAPLNGAALGLGLYPPCMNLIIRFMFCAAALSPLTTVHLLSPQTLSFLCPFRFIAEFVPSIPALMLVFST